jgi:hypothetical protein
MQGFANQVQRGLIERLRYQSQVLHYRKHGKFFGGNLFIIILFLLFPPPFMFLVL